MAVLKKIRSRWWSQGEDEGGPAEGFEPPAVSPLVEVRYEVRPLTVAQLDECWRLDQRCFVDGSRGRGRRRSRSRRCGRCAR